MSVLRLLFASEEEAIQLAPRIVQKSKTEFADSELQAKVVELVERLLMTRFAGYDVEGIRMKFKLHDIRKSKAWQQLREEGVKEGREEGKTRTKRELVQKWTAKGMTDKEIAELLDVSVAEVRKLANGHAR
jgi:predicted transposase/invertase (TIGR01784 family)